MKHDRDLYAIIMAGGRSERLWPLSSEKCPKPFLNLIGQKSLIQQTILRLKPLVPDKNILIVLGKKHLSLAKKQLPFIASENFLIEPMAKDTAASVGLSSIILDKRNPNAKVVVCPSDHYIPEEDKFQDTLKVATEIVSEWDGIVTLGIIPNRVETGYGYIEKGKLVKRIKGISIFEAKGFKEKPSYPQAKQYIKKGTYLWNSGIFIFKNNTIQSLIKIYLPRLWDGLIKIRESLVTPKQSKVIRKIFKSLDPISIDYGIMEKTKDIRVIESHFQWDDIGNWSSFRRLFSADSCGNVCIGNSIGIDSKNCILYSPTNRIIVWGISDLVVVNYKDKTLVCPVHKAPALKELLKILPSKVD